MEPEARIQFKRADMKGRGSLRMSLWVRRSGPGADVPISPMAHRSSSSEMGLTRSSSVSSIGITGRRSSTGVASKIGRQYDQKPSGSASVPRCAVSQRPSNMVAAASLRLM